MFLGAGLAVPTIRWMGENLNRSLPNAFMIRVNPRDPFVHSQLENKSIGLDINALAACKIFKRE